MWCPAVPNDWSKAGLPGDSLGKLRHIIDLCTELGAGAYTRHSV